MKYPLSVNWAVGLDPKGRQLRSKACTVLAEADLGRYGEFELPRSFAGSLLDVSQQLLLHLGSSKTVDVGFRGSLYKFEELEMDGTFQLRRSW